MLFCRLLIFFKSTFSKNSFRNTIRVSNSLDPDQVRRFVGPELGPNYLLKLSADDTSRQTKSVHTHNCIRAIWLRSFKQFLQVSWRVSLMSEFNLHLVNLALQIIYQFLGCNIIIYTQKKRKKILSHEQGCGNTMCDLSDRVPVHSGQVENFYLLVLGQVQMY